MKPEILAYIEAREEVLGRVRALLIENLDVRCEADQIDGDTPLFGSGLGLDSIDAVELALLLEERFGLRFEDEIMGRVGMRTVNSVVDAVLALRTAP